MESHPPHSLSAPGSNHLLPPEALRSTRLLAGALGGALGVASLGLILTNLVSGRQTEYIAISMECTAVVSGVFAVLFALGRFRQGPGMALACIAGTFFVCAVLSHVALRGTLELASGRSIALRSLTLARIAGALLMGGLGAFEVLRRSPQSRRFGLRALAVGVPLAAIVGGGVLAIERITSGSLLGVAWLTWTLAAMGAIGAVALACAFVHFVIRAFECGRPDAPRA